MKLKARYILPAFYLAVVIVTFTWRMKTLGIIMYILTMPTLLIIGGFLDLLGVKGSGTKFHDAEFYFTFIMATLSYFGLGYLFDIAARKLHESRT
jgi:hypothetical protein